MVAVSPSGRRKAPRTRLVPTKVKVSSRTKLKTPKTTPPRKRKIKVVITSPILGITVSLLDGDLVDLRGRTFVCPVIQAREIKMIILGIDPGINAGAAIFTRDN